MSSPEGFDTTSTAAATAAFTVTVTTVTTAAAASITTAAAASTTPTGKAAEKAKVNTNPTTTTAEATTTTTTEKVGKNEEPAEALSIFPTNESEAATTTSAPVATAAAADNNLQQHDRTSCAHYQSENLPRTDEYVIPPALSEFKSRDMIGLRIIQSTGRAMELLDQQWDTHQQNWENSLSKLVGRNVKVMRLDFFQRKGNIDLDEEMRNEELDGIFIHNKKHVLFATLSVELCAELQEQIAKKIQFDPNPSDSVAAGIKKQIQDEHGNNTSTLPCRNKSLDCANYGCSVRNQYKSYIPQYTTSRKCYVKYKSVDTKPRSLVDEWQQFWDKYLLPVYDTAEGNDGFRGPKANRVDRFPSLESKESYLMPWVRLSSVPKSENEILVIAARFETGCRRLAEELLLDVFSALPYTLVGHISFENVAEFYKKNKQVNACESLGFRPLNKGSLGNQLTKSLHDDQNGLIIPSIWQCLKESKEEVVRFQFRTMQLSWSIKSTSNRFAMFNGYIPHKTRVEGNAKYDSD
eukprot:CAMPEP_0113393882 /NCGR_PEP_ID=MMETSP0013_2-20120614/12171_1 /TAXON_ID=2843 ORGANISM="Skeletonema costatum, Strain 1716" /NCGR_SAMPLE_ID=MMETSP0013_2 /ASSEMBLY_ACC=CAM_ASM_000158 /LENGTH=521 /DNA_ID=CAMNT_0000277603 /DNA_START=210 /DNA_END=1774 /DNA_ORIENTATION=+ /assembly_acc=CAM_ASM_000158